MFFLLNGARYPVATLISFAITIILAFAYHEFAHALVADRLGDPTPRSYGRMSLNPFVHLDKVGTIMVLLFGFGYAYTPINPSRLQGNPRVSHAIVAVAGPLANLLMAALFALPIRLGLVAMAPPTSALPSLYSFLALGVFANLLLFAFNLLPIPPLDGFTVLQGILPAEMAYRLEPLRRYGLLILLGALFLLPRLGLDLIGDVIFGVIGFFLPLMMGPVFQLFF